MGMLQIIDDESVLFDFDDPSGAANPNGLKTRIDDLDIGEVESEESTFAAGRPGLRIASRIPRQATMSWIMRVDPYSSVDEGIAGVRALGRLLEAGGVMLYQPDGATQRKFIDYLPASSSPLIRGQPRGLRKILQLLQDPDGAAFEVRRQPFLRGDELDSSVNKLKNPTLRVDLTAPTGTPDDWTWDSTTSITNQSIDADLNAFRFDIATTGVRMLQQTTAAASFAAGDVASFYFYGWVSAGTDVRVRCRIEYLTSGGGVLATHDAGALTILGTDLPDFSDLTQAVALTAPAAPATTDKVRVSMRFENSAATSRTVWLTLAQAEETGAPSLWVPGEQPVPNDPASSGGRVFPVVIHGDGPSPVSIRVKGPAAGAQPRSFLLGVKDARQLPEYLNTRKIIQAESSGLLGPDTTTFSDSAASPGSGTSALQITFSTYNELASDRAFWAVSTLLGSLDGLLDVWIRLRGVAGTVYELELQEFDNLQAWGSVGYRQVTPPTTDYMDVRLGQIDRIEGTGALNLRLHCKRVSGSGSLYIDFLFLVPPMQSAVLDAVGSITSTKILRTHPDAEDSEFATVEQASAISRVPTTKGPVPAWLEPGAHAIIAAGGQADVASGLVGKTTLGMISTLSIRYAPRYNQ